MGEWSEDLDLSQHARKLINETPALTSLLYDLDLLPEQLASQHEKTPGLIKAYHRLYGVLYGWQAATMTARPTPAASDTGDGR